MNRIPIASHYAPLYVHINIGIRTPRDILNGKVIIGGGGSADTSNNLVWTGVLAPRRPYYYQIVPFNAVGMSERSSVSSPCVGAYDSEILACLSFIFFQEMRQIVQSTHLLLLLVLLSFRYHNSSNSKQTNKQTTKTTITITITISIHHV